MKKYSPSLKINNKLKDEVVGELKAVIYKLEKGKFDVNLDKDEMSKQVKQLKELCSSFEMTIGTGNENVGVLYTEVKKQIKTLKTQSEQSLMHRFENAVDDISYTICLWKDVLNGNTVMETSEDFEKEKLSRRRKRLNSKLTELEIIKENFTANEKRIEGEIALLEKDLQVHENAMISEDNERKINDLFREIKAVKSKIDMMSVRKSNYSACYNLLDMIYSNAREILQATGYSSDEIAKAKAFLNIDRLKSVISDPDKAISILKQMDKDIKSIVERTAIMDKKVFGLENGTTTVSDDALKYKEELMRKKREKEGLNAEIIENSSIKNETENNTEVK